MREIHPTLACHQEFATDRRHGVIQIHFDAARRQRFGGHQASRAAANNGNARATNFYGGR
jgi:hypothetical protein